ncbi:hypothetical protein [Pseudomonas sp. LP_7_YM]|uniref:hypothetical protein n=1 Tax=Pseudomonas sp. LP_7_YM TaxID=2485137 RepID=UPI0010DD0CD3|nr:hypothetical protein [Pseudomonas sp. LP_7_YM]TDV70163.1 hypothetical protein EC915_102428 [Pseudomonas sp. LP_7_YM]
MTKKAGVSSTTDNPPLKLAEAIEEYVAQGGVINVVPEGETGETKHETEKNAVDADAQALLSAKIEQLKGLVAKGAGVSALQYSLRMNRKEIKRLANENGLKILYSRPVRGSRLSRSRETPAIDDTVAGHAMHYSTLGYTVPEIAQLLELSIRDVWNIGKAYRFEFKSAPLFDSPAQPLPDVPEA